MVADDLKQALKPGELFASKYRLGPALGEGGMGLVLSATHELTRERVALKILLARGDKSDTARQRFLNEARAAVQIKSEHVARVLDADVTAEGVSFLVIELLEGCDLRRLIAERGPLPPGDAVSHVMQACEGLAEAHALGIVHRDIKPENLFLARRKDGSGLVKLLDFGISRQARLGDPRLTRTRGAMGSPLYMSPEQMLDPRNADERSDIWSLGVTLFELLTAVAPFQAETSEGLAIEIATRPHPPLLSLRPGLPPALGAVVDRCLAKVPDLRFASVRELARALADLALPHGHPAAPPPDSVPCGSLVTLDPEASAAPSRPSPTPVDPPPAPSDPGPPLASSGPAPEASGLARYRWLLWAVAALISLFFALLPREPLGAAPQGNQARLAPELAAEPSAQAPIPSAVAALTAAGSAPAAPTLVASAFGASVPAASAPAAPASAALASAASAPSALSSRPRREPAAQVTKKTQGLPDFGGR